LGGILHAVVVDEIRPPAQAEPLLPVVRGLLERDPDLRLDATEAERLLRAFLDTGRTPRASSGYTPTQRDVARRKPVPASPAPTAPTTASAPADRPPSKQSAHSARGVLIAAALVAAMAGAGVSAAALLLNKGGDGGDTPTSSAPHSAPAPPRPTKSAPTPTTSAPTPTVTVTSSGVVAPASRKAPSGYRLAQDPAGFSLAVPEGFTREAQGERTFYLSAGETFRLGIKTTDPEPDGPTAVMRRAAAKGPSTNPGYHDGRVTATTHNGYPAALWEFSWGGFTKAEGARHTYDLCWEQDGRMYDVWVSAPVGKVTEAKEYFDVAVDTFVP
jgi:hypothetical protein